MKSLYARVNQNIASGKNEHITISEDRTTWRLNSLKIDSDPNIRLFKEFQKCSIVSVMQFAENKTGFTT